MQETLHIANPLYVTRSFTVNCSKHSQRIYIV